jgi:hypothetical protein
MNIENWRAKGVLEFCILTVLKDAYTSEINSQKTQKCVSSTLQLKMKINLRPPRKYYGLTFNELMVPG